MYASSSGFSHLLTPIKGVVALILLFVIGKGSDPLVAPLSALPGPHVKKFQLFGIFFFFLLLFGFCPALSMADDSVSLIRDWQYTLQDSADADKDVRLWLQQDKASQGWLDTSLPQHLQGSNGKSFIWLRTVLPAMKFRESALFIPPVYLLMTVYLDGEVIYTFDDSGEARGLPWHLIDLPADFAGRELVLHITSNYNKIGLSGEIMIGPRSALVESIIRRDADRIVIGLLVGVVGLLALGFSPRRQEAAAYIAFGAYALCLAGWIISHSYIKQLVLPYNTFWFYVWLTSLAGMFPGFMLYVEKVFGHYYRNVIFRLRQFYLVFVPAVVVLYWVQGSTPLVHVGLNAVRLLLIAGAVISVLEVGRQVFHGRRDAWIFLVGFVVLALFAAHDVGVALNLVTEGRTLGHWGGLILVLIMASILGMRFNDMYHRLAVYSQQLESTARERELMVQDLHDGLGGMATNISLLADVAQRQSDDPQVKSTLKTISGLSRESVSEIRSFMKSLDNTSADWPSFVADLRQYGGSTLEPHGTDFTLTEQIDSGAEPPNGILRLNVFRIYKEVMVNIVKHAGAKNVEVQLDVTPYLFKLTIHDDGVGLDSQSRAEEIHHSGRGLGNIHARAVEMGGEAHIDSDNGTRVDVVIPLPLKSPALGIDSEEAN